MKIPFIRRISEFISSAIGTTIQSVRTLTYRYRSFRSTPTKSWGRADYDYWKRAYYCQVSGLEVSGLFIRPIVNKIAAWALGRSPNFNCDNEASQRELENWWDLHHSEILDAFRESLKQGDSFLVVNSDLSVTIISPDAVDAIVAEDDYSKIIGWRITQILPHPTRTATKMTVIDEYYVDKRVHSEEFSNGKKRTVVYANPTGIIPVIHIANQPAAGEVFGHPEAQALIETFHKYGQTLDAAIEGNILQGRPTPVISFDTVQDLNTFWRRYGKEETQTLADGTTQKVETLSVDLSEILTVSGAVFDYKSPGTFSEDTERLLGLMFYLILEHIELPEFVFGNAISSSKASAETQMPIFEIFIRMRQKNCLQWILQIAKVVLGYLSLIVPGVGEDSPTLQWPKLTQNGRLTLEAVSWAHGEGLLDNRTALMLLPLDIEKLDEILKQAEIDAEERDRKALEQQKKQIEMSKDAAPDVDPSLKREIEDLDI